MPSQSKMWLGAGVGAFGVTLLAGPPLIKWLRQKPEAISTTKAWKPEDYHFGGPIGTYVMMLGLPGVIYFLYYSCDKDIKIGSWNLRTLMDMPTPKVSDFVSTKAASILFGWFGFHVFLERVLPGEVAEGVDLAPAGGKGKLKYNINGHKAFWASMALAGACGTKLSVLYDEFAPLAGLTILGCTAFSAYLYAASFAPGALLTKGGNSGNPIFDFWMGRELNPRFGSFDLKEFNELRPGLIGWVMLNLGCAAKQYELTGAVSPNMVLVNLMQGVYVWDALWHEKAILTTMDITTDGFGFMLCFGDLAWVPFTYTLQALYIVNQDAKLSPLALAITTLMAIGGFTIFRCANSEKDAFRSNPDDPSVKHLKTIEVQNLQTGRPSKLLVSGWWGMARKINYTGDWMMAWAWSMTTGSPYSQGLPAFAAAYFYPVYFGILLVHRAWRDERFCSEKYGEGWKEYKKRVPYIFVPYLI